MSLRCRHAIQSTGHGAWNVERAVLRRQKVQGGIGLKTGADQAINILAMSLLELEQEVRKLSPLEFSAFTRWLDEYAATQWDDRIEKDVAAGRFETLLNDADRAFEADQCQEL